MKRLSNTQLSLRDRLLNKGNLENIEEFEKKLESKRTRSKIYI